MGKALEGRTFVIIGGTTGLGYSAARACIAEGAKIIGCGRDEGSARSARDELGSDFHEWVGDAREPETAERAIALAHEVFGGFDGLYHVAGGSGRKMGDGALHEITDAGWEETLHLNLTSLFYSNRAAVRAFLESGKGGSILNMGSVLGFSPSPEYFSTHAYATTKAAIEGFSKSVSARYAADDIRINVVAPALVETPMARRAAGDEAVLRFISRKQPLDGGRIGKPEDLDAAVVYFLSDASRFVTGQVLYIDGGWRVSEGNEKRGSADG